jgi:hypothetical protein
MGLRVVPPSDPRDTDPQFAGGLAKINPAGLREEDLQRIRDITDQGIKELEDRYKEPNLFKVAAGFAKPQLGGFLASLGSASEAMAENVEQQRENVLPITNLKNQRELANTLLGQKINQRDIFDKWLATKRPMDSNTFQSIMRLGTDTDIARSAEKYWSEEQKRINAVGSATELQQKYPSLKGAFEDLIDFATKPDAKPEEIAAQREALRVQQDSAMPKMINPAAWAGMSLDQRQIAIAEEAKNEQKTGLDILARLRVDHDDAVKRLPKMTDIRDLALGKGLPSVTIKDVYYERQLLEKNIQTWSTVIDGNGKPLINPKDALRLRNINNFEMAELYLANTIEEKERRAEEEKAKRAEENAKAQQESVAQAKEAEKQMLKDKIESEHVLDDFRAKNKKEEILLEGILKIMDTVAKTEGATMPPQIQQLAELAYQNIAIPLFAENEAMKNTIAQSQAAPPQGEGAQQEQVEGMQQEQGEVMQEQPAEELQQA